jgi:hypothetical protein
LCSTGLFETFEFGGETEINNYTEYKHGLPHLRTTGWVYPSQTLIIFPAAFSRLDPIEKVLVRIPKDRNIHISKEIEDLTEDDITKLPLPRLAPLLNGLGRRYLDTADDVSMIALEQLVDGMNPDERWVQDNLVSDSAVTALVMGLVRDKKSRIDYFSENKVTCFIKDEEEAGKVRLIPGLE